MKDSPLINKSKTFALEVLKICKELRATKCEGVLINQFIRSGTSIGANIREAFYAHSKKDFISKLQIALKECYETEYWIELLIDGGYYNNREIQEKCIEIKKNINIIHQHCKREYEITCITGIESGVCIFLCSHRNLI